MPVLFPYFPKGLLDKYAKDGNPYQIGPLDQVSASLYKLDYIVTEKKWLDDEMIRCALTYVLGHRLGADVSIGQYYIRVENASNFRPYPSDRDIAGLNEWNYLGIMPTPETFTGRRFHITVWYHGDALHWTATIYDREEATLYIFDAFERQREERAQRTVHTWAAILGRKGFGTVFRVVVPKLTAQPKQYECGAIAILCVRRFFCTTEELPEAKPKTLASISQSGAFKTFQAPDMTYIPVADWVQEGTGPAAALESVREIAYSWFGHPRDLPLNPAAGSLQGPNRNYWAPGSFFRTFPAPDSNVVYALIQAIRTLRVSPLMALALLDWESTDQDFKPPFIKNGNEYAEARYAFRDISAAGDFGSQFMHDAARAGGSLTWEDLRGKYPSALQSWNRSFPLIPARREGTT